MKKRLLSIALAVCLVLGTAGMTQAEVKSIGSPGSDKLEIVVEGSIYSTDYVEFMKATAYAKNMHINIYLHTSGGDAYTTIGIVNRILDLKDRGCTITTIVQGQALSAGTYIFMMGDERIAYEGATFMTHLILQQRPRAYANEMRKSSREAAVKISQVERMDRYIEARFRKVVGDKMSEKAIQYFLHGTKEEDIKSQYFSARTAYNMGVATQFISADR
jgi:ATP-dependent protease ClpP protease subunit